MAVCFSPQHLQTPKREATEGSWPRLPPHLPHLRNQVPCALLPEHGYCPPFFQPVISYLNMSSNLLPGSLPCLTVPSSFCSSHPCPTALKVTSGPNPVQHIVQTIQCNPLLPALPTSYLSLSASPCPNLTLRNPSFFFGSEGAIPFDRNTTDLLFPSCRTPTHPSSPGLSHPFLWET